MKSDHRKEKRLENGRYEGKVARKIGKRENREKRWQEKLEKGR